MIKLLHPTESRHDAVDAHNCQETLRRVLLLIDRELDAAAEINLMEELNKCSDCLDKFQIEKEFKLFLAKKIGKRSCKDTLVNDIKAQINRLSGNA